MEQTNKPAVVVHRSCGHTEDISHLSPEEQEIQFGLEGALCDECYLAHQRDLDRRHAETGLPRY